MLTISTLTESIERLLEPVARAIRRGDEAQITNTLERLRTLWRESSTFDADQDEARARGLTHALEGVLGFALARCGADTRRSLLQSRKHALPILHVLGLQAQQHNPLDAGDGSMPCHEVAQLIGAKPQNIRDLVTTMNECDLVEVTEEGTSKHVSITNEGALLLEASLPGWQLMDKLRSEGRPEPEPSRWFDDIGGLRGIPSFIGRDRPGLMPLMRVDILRSDGSVFSTMSLRLSDLAFLSGGLLGGLEDSLDTIRKLNDCGVLDKNELAGFRRQIEYVTNRMESLKQRLGAEFTPAALKSSP